MPNLRLLVLLRHGESIWNAQNRFTGWTDVPLSPLGQAEAQRAGQALAAAGFAFDVAFTSVLQRATTSLARVLAEVGQPDLPIHSTWQLNERHYGALQGLNKTAAAQALGAARVTAWRRSYTGCPPALEWDDHRHPRFDPRYAHLPPAILPRTESLQDTTKRLLPYWQAHIAPALRAGQRVLLLGHGNTLRPLVRHLEDIHPSDMPKITIATGVPRIYHFNIDLILQNYYDIA